MSAHDRSYISFYNEAGQALRESMVVDLPTNHGTVYRMARRKAKELGATSFAIFICVRIIEVDTEREI